MSPLVSDARIEDDTPSGGPIRALVIAIPVSLALWAGMVWALLKLVH